jgi:hypothetical protein
VVISAALNPILVASCLWQDVIVQESVRHLLTLRPLDHQVVQNQVHLGFKQHYILFGRHILDHGDFLLVHPDPHGLGFRLDFLQM